MEEKENQQINQSDSLKSEAKAKTAAKKEDPVIEQINSHREIPQSEIDKAPLLILKEEEKGTLFNNKDIKINAAGMIGGGRGARDGIAIFGLVKNEKENLTTDFNLNYSDDLPLPYIFAVYYDTTKKGYFIRAYNGKENNNRILFIKLSGNNNLILKQREIISCGNSIFQISPMKDHKLEIINISKESAEKNTKVFDPETIKEVTIGRLESCSISFPKDKSFSRVQTSFFYDDTSQEWTIVDGSKNKSSTNGTWVFGTHSFLIKDEMVVEILTSKVVFSFVKGEN